MATKKPNQPEDFVDTTRAEPIPEELPPEPVPAPAPVKVLHTGYHELTDDESRRVAKTKADFGTLIGYLKSLRDSVHDAEAQRMYSVAITHAETASMWAVRAITHRG